METIRQEVWINASNERVFEAITRREGLDAWWGKALNGEPQIDYVVEFDHGLGDPLRMRITDLVTDERVAWSCISDFSDSGSPASEWLGHRLLFDLTTAEDDPAYEWLAPRLGFDSKTGEDVTILSFQHAGWSDSSRWFAFCNWSWGVTLAGLERYCETGQPTGEGEH